MANAREEKIRQMKEKLQEDAQEWEKEIKEHSEKMNISIQNMTREELEAMKAHCTEYFIQV